MLPPEQATASDPPPPPATVERARLHLWMLGVVAFAVLLFLLVQAKFILISLAIAIILFSLTSDAIGFIAGLRLGRARVSPVVASAVALALIASGLLSLTAIVLSQANTVVVTVLAYAEPAQKALAQLFSWLGADVEAAVLASMQQVRAGDYLRTVAGQASNLLSATVLIILFVGFLFAERVWFSTKLTSLLHDADRAARVERIIGSIIHRVNRYLLVKTLVSIVTGVLAYAVLRLFALELAFPVALLTFVLNYIPNVGSIVATVAAALVGYVQTGDTYVGLGLLAVLTAIQFVVGQVIDPLLLGRTLRMSAFGIICSLAFWASVWGIPGMFLAVPIMVALMIVCAHVPGLRPIAVLLSREGLPETDLEIAADRGAAGARVRAPQPD
jgi:predicted PurR-regulated permease PerM